MAPPPREREHARASRPVHPQLPQLPHTPLPRLQVARLREDHMRPINPTPYKVSVTNELYTRLHAAWLEESPIPEIN